MQSEKSYSSHFFNVISILTHPVFVPTYVFLFWMLSQSPVLFGLTPKSIQLWLFMVAYITILFPVLTVVLLRKLNFIESIQMHGLKERYAPLIASMLFYFWIYWVFHKSFNAHLLIQSFFLGVFLTTVFIFMASIFYKISMHTAAWGSIATFAIVYAFQGMDHYFLFTIVSVLMAGIVGTARASLKAHTHFELYTGYAAGIFAQVISYFISTII